MFTLRQISIFIEYYNKRKQFQKGTFSDKETLLQLNFFVIEFGSPQNNNQNFLKDKNMYITLHEHSVPGFNLFETKNHFLVHDPSQNQIETQQKVIPHQYCLSIDRFTGLSNEVNQKEFFDLLRNQEPLGQKGFWAIYGVIVVEEVPYLALVKQAKLVTPTKQYPIFQVQNLIFIRFYHNKDILPTQEQTKILELINNDLVSQNFFFSYDEDLTVSFKKKTKKQNDDSSDSKFFWNQKNIRFLQESQLSKPWIVPMIQGYVDTISEKGIQYRIIARRSKHKSGTRYNNRGINLQGFASNFVEVEERIEYADKIFSFITLRGSIPLFWSQQNNMSPIQFQQTQQKDLRGLKKHYDSLSADYQCTINTINLLSDTKSTEKSLTQKFVKALEKCGIKEYYYFDLNSFQGEPLHRGIENFVASYEEKQATDNFDFYDTQMNKKVSSQHHIPRVNCLDCIDRTNVICCRIGEKFVQKVAKILKIQLSSKFHAKYLENWAMLGNKISQIYCGTYSVAQHLTLKQQVSYWSSFTSGWRSVTRFFNASQSDSYKETCNQYLLKQHPKSSTTYFSNNIFKYHLKHTDYSQLINIDVSIITWNLGATSSQQLMEADKMAFAGQIFGNNHEKAPGIIFITLQQIVELNSYNVVTNDNAAAKKSWQTIFFSILNHYNTQHAGFTYTLYFSQALVGITSFVFVKNSLNPQIDMLNRTKKIFSYEVRRGFGQMMGNKGAIVSGFYVFDSIIINVSSHLAAGDQKRNQRLQDIKAILNTLNTNPQASKVSRLADYKFFTGDLNFRLGSSDQQTRKMINEAKKIEKAENGFPNSSKNTILYRLFQKDELMEVYSDENCLKDFHEYPITFYPTYRYVKNGEEHDNKRKPGWTDRILYYSQQKHNIHCERYTAIDKVKISDHRAVLGEFKMAVRVEDKEKKESLIDQFLTKGRQKKRVIQQPMMIFPKSRYNYQ